ncbi:Tctex1 domain-containing protein 1 [Hondaea fermentalgiana]|uniref:Tctex1 domain-containing protein 1 n=1 Tax=Hondaea fermentalgiana TaxID=2315210 RepID=A0A2R5GXX2_9STRA|nr:Tctex1 domain-containing protein 1 [Hondaea fermentalgiana]|eukprot:GBG33563.1 Tctex1 domain-containing protein 1 [Hondaea fermentalgiana]
MEESGGTRVIRILQPTYETEPVLDGRFTKNSVEELCTPVVHEYLEGKRWSEEKEINSDMSQTVTNLVMEKIRELNLSRYKVVVQTNLGENCDQTVRVVSHCLWESSLDSTAEIKFQSVPEEL